MDPGSLSPGTGQSLRCSAILGAQAKMRLPHRITTGTIRGIGPRGFHRGLPPPTATLKQASRAWHELLVLPG